MCPCLVCFLTNFICWEDDDICIWKPCTSRKSFFNSCNSTLSLISDVMLPLLALPYGWACLLEWRHFVGCLWLVWIILEGRGSI